MNKVVSLTIAYDNKLDGVLMVGQNLYEYYQYWLSQFPPESLSSYSVSVRSLNKKYPTNRTYQQVTRSFTMPKGLKSSVVGGTNVCHMRGLTKIAFKYLWLEDSISEEDGEKLGTYYEGRIPRFYLLVLMSTKPDKETGQARLPLPAILEQDLITGLRNFTDVNNILSCELLYIYQMFAEHADLLRTSHRIIKHGLTITDKPVDV